jgi:hypothetical protein
MKKITLLLGAAAIIGIGSAFTTAQQSGETEYVFDGENYILKTEAPGTCIDAPDVCTYVLDGSGQPIPLDPNEHARYTPNP